MHGAAMKEAIPQRRSADVDIAVLQVQFTNLEEKVVDLKDGMRDVRQSIVDSQHQISKELSALSMRQDVAHKALTSKISALEKWRWMLMGGGMVIGTVGWNIFTHWEIVLKMIK